MTFIIKNSETKWNSFEFGAMKGKEFFKYATVQLQCLPDATRLALWFRTITAPGTLIVVIRGVGNMYGAASKTWNKIQECEDIPLDQPIFQVNRETCLYWEGSKSSVNDREPPVYLAKFMTLVKKNCGHNTHLGIMKLFANIIPIHLASRGILILVYWKMAGGSRDSVTVLWSGLNRHESTSTAWKAKLEGFNVEDVRRCGREFRM
ncbi:hypothetical protein B0H14DRAFT_2558524 [Mycena olivaceomarginata]|nr:hypothetical protein B0H14DRAFT_2558524 [Mycena olivaceomarginata]